MAENVDLGFKISGIIALVTLGLFMSAFGKTRISSEADHAVHTFWFIINYIYVKIKISKRKYIVFCAETVIFLLAGILVGIDVISVLLILFSFQISNFIDLKKGIGHQTS